ncbi:TIGR02270 family protein [Marinimicrobium sp. LS-A18]|uniref:TIGR02270 family protein n=1 Tax=Marinimicrobium sp. LS-A18 TaxID=1381596 RepID=UPI000463016F|nr:TIGR02270 family protein [Marinimicrobium sp. LS-A18]
MTVAITAFPNPFSGFESQFDDCVEEVAFLWLLRSRALIQPHYQTSDLAELESRIDAQLFALAQAPERAWASCQSALAHAGPGEVFAAAAVAFRTLEVGCIQQAVEAGLQDEAGFAALVSALTWLPGRYCHDWVRKFFISKEHIHKRLALATCRARGEDPCDFLTRILRRNDCRADSLLHGEALHCVGVFKRRDLSPFLAEGRESGEPVVTFEACRSAILLGDRSAAKMLMPFALQPGPRQCDALILAMRMLPSTEAKQWVAQLFGQTSPDAARLSVIATAALGDPEAVPWLLRCMKQLSLARVAGEAFYQITGVDLQAHDLHHQLPHLNDAEAQDHPDTPVPPMDDDEHLPWPNTEKLTVFWETIKHRYPPGERLLLGEPVTEANLQRVLSEGPQRQRAAAALELALLDPQQSWYSMERRQELS